MQLMGQIAMTHRPTWLWVSLSV